MRKYNKALKDTLASYHQKLQYIFNAFLWPNTMVYIAQKTITYHQIEWHLQIFDPKDNEIQNPFKNGENTENLHKIIHFCFKNK